MLIEGETVREVSDKPIKAQAADVKGRTEIAQVASISAADEQIGELIADAMERVGKDGVVSVEEEKHTVGLSLEFAEGVQWDKGFLSPNFVTVKSLFTCTLVNSNRFKPEGS